MKTARVGLTSSDILFLKQIYAKDPNEYGSNSLDTMDPLEPAPLTERTLEAARAHGSNKVFGGKAGHPATVRWRATQSSVGGA